MNMLRTPKFLKRAKTDQKESFKVAKMGLFIKDRYKHNGKDNCMMVKDFFCIFFNLVSNSKINFEF